MAKKKVVRRKERPQLSALMLCDALVRDPNSGKANLFGVFDKFVIPAVPAVTTPFWVYARLKGGSGKFTVGVMLSKPGSKNPEYQGNTNVVVPCAKKRGSDLGILVQQLQVTKFGHFEFHLTLDEKPIGQPYAVEVERPPK